jgi:hypothetical protein
MIVGVILKLPTSKLTVRKLDDGTVTVSRPPSPGVRRVTCGKAHLNAIGSIEAAKRALELLVLPATEATRSELTGAINLVRDPLTTEQPR